MFGQTSFCVFLFIVTPYLCLALAVKTYMQALYQRFSFECKTIANLIAKWEVNVFHILKWGPKILKIKTVLLCKQQNYDNKV